MASKTTTIDTTKAPTYAPTQRTGKATPENLWSILGTRTVEITDKGMVWSSPLPDFFPQQDAAGDDPAEAIDALITQFGASEILGKILSQLLIDYRATCRANYGKPFNPSAWTPNIAPLRRPDELEKQLEALKKIAQKSGKSVDELLALLRP